MSRGCRHISEAVHSRRSRLGRPQHGLVGSPAEPPVTGQATAEWLPLPREGSSAALGNGDRREQITRRRAHAVFRFLIRPRTELHDRCALLTQPLTRGRPFEGGGSFRPLENTALAGLFLNAGGGTRTPDTRIMIEGRHGSPGSEPLPVRDSRERSRASMS